MQETYQSGAISKHSTKQGNCLAGLETELCLSGGRGTQARAVLKLSFHSMGGDTEKLFSIALAEGCIITKKKKKKSLHSVYNILGAMVHMQKF